MTCNGTYINLHYCGINYYRKKFCGTGPCGLWRIEALNINWKNKLFERFNQHLGADDIKPFSDVIVINQPVKLKEKDFFQLSNIFHSKKSEKGNIMLWKGKQCWNTKYTFYLESSGGKISNSDSFDQPYLKFDIYESLSRLFKVAGVKVYLRQTWNFRPHAVSTCSNHLIGTWCHSGHEVMGRCMQFLHGLGCFDFVLDIPLVPATLRLFSYIVNRYYLSIPNLWIFIPFSQFEHPKCSCSF